MATKSIAQTVNTSNFAGKQKSVLRDLFEANASLNSITPTGGTLTVTGSISATGPAALRAINAISDYTALQMGTASTVYGQIGWGTGGELVYNSAAGATRQHVFQTGGSNRAVIDSAGVAVTGSISATANVTFSGLPTSASGLPSGGLWNDGGTIKIA